MKMILYVLAIVIVNLINLWIWRNDPLWKKLPSWIFVIIVIKVKISTTVMIKFMKTRRKPEIKHTWSRLCRAGWRRKKENQTYFPLDYHDIHHDLWCWSWFIMILFASSHLVSVLATRSLAQWSMMDVINQKLNFYGVATSPILDVDLVNIFSWPSCQ